MTGPDVTPPDRSRSILADLGTATVEGTGFHHRELQTSVAVFKGIRYATARRWCRPELDEPTGSVDARTYRAQCPQLTGTLERLLGASSIPTAEACLHLNITTPACDDARRPVLVWVHGGAFVTGGGAMPWYHGASLAGRGEVVVVSINYRLGALGFTGSSNLGLADQITALEWVHRHIGAFGGDPEQVTVFGESAGGASVLALLAAPSARDLFGAAWAMSPSIPQLRDAEQAEQALDRLLRVAGTDRAGLEQLPLDAVLDAQREVLADPKVALTAFAPTVDGDLLPGPVRDGVIADARPLVLGTNRDEMHLFTAFDDRLASLDDRGLAEAVARRLGQHSGAAIARYRAARPGSTPAQVLSAVQTDEMFRIPADRWLRQRSAAGPPCWSYWFTWPTPAFGGLLGSCHGLDIPFAFHNLDRPGVVMFTGDGEDRGALADRFCGALVEFAHHRDPGWDRFEPEMRSTRRFDADVETLHDPEPELFALWGMDS